MDEIDHLDKLIVLAHNQNALTKKADLVLPASTYAESEGTFTNIAGRVQHFKSALVTRENNYVNAIQFGKSFLEYLNILIQIGIINHPKIFLMR